MGAGLATQHAPSFRLVEAHFGLGLAGLLAFAAALVAGAPRVEGFYFTPLALALVHLCVLGWLMPIAIGALHQLVPVVFEVPVRSERLAWAALALYVPSVTALVWRMWSMPPTWALPAAATGVATSLALYAANLVATLRRSRVPSLTGRYVVAALGWLLVAVTLGATLAWNLWRPLLPVAHFEVLRAHAHAAGLGFFGLLIMGVAYRLLEVFLLSHGALERAGRVALVAGNLAVAALVLSPVPSLTTATLALAAVAAPVAVTAFLVQVRAIWRRRTQRRPDVAWRHTATSFAWLGLAAATGVALAAVPLAPPWWERLRLAYGVVALVGFVGTIVVGQLYKIVPFLVWLHRFAPCVGLKKVPTTSELLPERPKRVQYWLMHAGIAAFAAGIVVDAAGVRVAGAAAFAASAALLVRNLVVIHARRP